LLGLPGGIGDGLIFNFFSGSGGNQEGGRKLSEYSEKRIVVHDVPAGSRPVVESRYDSVVEERQGMSGVAVAALIVAAITAAVVITMLIINSQQKTSEDQLAQERARTAAALQTPAPPAPQQPIIVMPAAQPAVMPVMTPAPVAAPPPPVYARSAPSSASVEIEVTSRLQNDEELRTYSIDVKVTGGTAILSGYVATDDLKKRAGKLAQGVSGVQNLINDIAVRP
jgi:hypothetical protein